MATSSSSRAKRPRAPSEPKREWITAADLLAGATLPVRVHLHVTLHADPAGAGGLAARLRPRAGKLLRWAKDDPQRARQLMLDPIAAADSAGVKLAADDRNLLERHARNAEVSSVMPAGFELVQLHVDASPSPRRPDPKPARTVPARSRAKAKRKQGGKRV